MFKMEEVRFRRDLLMNSLKLSQSVTLICGFLALTQLLDHVNIFTTIQNMYFITLYVSYD